MVMLKTSIDRDTAVYGEMKKLLKRNGMSFRKWLFLSMVEYVNKNRQLIAVITVASLLGFGAFETITTTVSLSQFSDWTTSSPHSNESEMK